MHIRVVQLWLPCERAASVQEGLYQRGWQQGVLLLSEDPCWSPASESIMRCTLKAVQVSSMAGPGAAVQVHLGSLCIPPRDRLNVKIYADLNERVFLLFWSLVCIYGLVPF